MDNNGISKMAERLARIEEKVNHIDKKTDRVTQMEVELRDVDARAKSAHRRLDNHDKWMFTIASTVIIAVITAVISGVTLL